VLSTYDGLNRLHCLRTRVDLDSVAIALTFATADSSSSCCSSSKAEPAEHSLWNHELRAFFFLWLAFFVALPEKLTIGSSECPHKPLALSSGPPAVRPCCVEVTARCLDFLWWGADSGDVPSSATRRSACWLRLRDS
jgi:hypothetical protein